MNAPGSSGDEESEGPLVNLKPAPLVRRRTISTLPGARWLLGAAAALLVSVSLGWYYTRPSVGTTPAMGRTVGSGSFRLPPLLMPKAAVAAPAPVAGAGEDAAAPPVSLLPPSPLRLTAAAPASAPAAVVGDPSPVLWRESAAPAPAAPSPAAATASASPLVPTLGEAGFSPARAVPLPPLSRVLTKGTSVGCTLETGIESQLAGLVSCLIGVPVYGADGRVVLLPRGTRLLGEARSEARSGQSRVFVLWVEARTPQGLLVPLVSPATDALGRAGVPGSVDTHFFQRFGAAILISVLDASVQAAVGRAGGTVVVAPQSSEAVLTEVLRATIAIPPTITVPPGTHLTVLVARDVDFGTTGAAAAGH